MSSEVFVVSLLLVTLGVALRGTLRLLYGARGPAPDDALYLFFRILSWGLLIVPGMLFIAGATSWLSLLLIVAIIESAIELFLARRNARRESLWQLLLMSLSSGRPAVDSLRYHQARFTGGFGRRFRQLLADLERGVSWQNAVSANSRIFPREAPSYAAMLATSPTVASDAQALTRTRDTAYIEVRQQIVQRLSYLVLASLMMLAVSSFVMIKIVPSFQDIFWDFDLELPTITLYVISFGEFFGRYLMPPIVLLFAMLFLAAAVTGILYLSGVPVLRPIIDRLTFSYHQAQLLRLFAVGFRQGLPITETFKRLEAGPGGYACGLARRRLQAAHSRALKGKDWIEALRSARLVTRPDAAALTAAQQVGNLPWTMEFLADRKMRLLGFHWSSIISILFALIVLFFGCVVAFFAVGMFVPLIDLINNLSG